jgi:hypothetical protein
MTVLANLFGRRLVVDYSFLHNLHFHLIQSDHQILLTLSGTIIESAKVVESIEIVPRGNAILITIYAALAVWNSSGSPDFEITKPLQLVPGIYDIQYLGRGGVKTLLNRVEISHKGIVELGA